MRLRMKHFNSHARKCRKDTGGVGGFSWSWLASKSPTKAGSLSFCICTWLCIRWLLHRKWYWWNHNTASLQRCSDYTDIQKAIVCRNTTSTLQWHHYGRDSVSNHQPHDCLLNRLFRCRSRKTSRPRVTDLCAGISSGTSEFPAQMASNAENISIWWRHHGTKDSTGITATFSRLIRRRWARSQHTWSPPPPPPIRIRICPIMIVITLQTQPPRRI